MSDPSTTTAGPRTVKVMEGLRVVDLTMWAFVPSVGGILAHWGADVIKVEGPRSPDPMRLLSGTLEPGGASWMFKHYSRGKRSIALDLNGDEGREILYRLVENADVFLTSYLPETRRKLRVDVDDIRARNPRIVYVRGTGQGPNGPEAERGAGDGPTFWNRGSLAESTKAMVGSDWPPGMIGHGDGMSGMSLVSGVLAALLQRERTGTAPIVDGSLLGTAIWFNGPAIIQSKRADVIFPPGSDKDREAARTNGPVFRTADGRHIYFVANLNDNDWADACERLGRPDLATDERFATAASRGAHYMEVVAALRETFGQWKLEDLKAALLTSTYIWAPLQTAEEMHDDPQAVANGFLRPVDYPDGPLTLPAPPILFDEEPGDPPRAPDFGEHTDEILGELGIDEHEITRLRGDGIVA